MTYFADMVSMGEGVFVIESFQKGAVMKKKSRIILTAVVILCMLAGCKEKEKITEPTPTVTIVPTVSKAPQPTKTENLHTVAPIQTTELPIYTISGDLTELTAVTALVGADREINEEIVTQAVTDALADSAIYVRVNHVERNGAVITVDFSATAPPVTQVGASIEGLILDAFGQSILDNIADCNGVAFSIDGEAYMSGHFEFEKDDIYLSR